MMTDIEIAQQCAMKPITEIAVTAHVDEKIPRTVRPLQGKNRPLPSAGEQAPGRQAHSGHGHHPHPAGEGKTTTTIGLADGLRRIGKDVTVALREPSRAGVRHQKGGAAGGGLGAGRADGRHQPALHRRLPRHRRGEQSPRRHARQPHPAGQHPRHRPPAASHGSAASI